MLKKDISINHHDRTVSFSYYLPEEKGKYPVVIFSHGYNGYQTDFETTCEYYAKSGIACVALTFCGGSTRDVSGFPSIKMSLGTEQEDLIAVLNYIKKDQCINENRIFLFGGSQGGLVSALVAARVKTEVAGLILLYPAFCIPDNWRDRFPNEDEIPETEEFWGLTLGKAYFMYIREMNVFDIIGGYEGPVLILQGREDLIAKENYAQKGKESYKNCRIELFAEESHGFSDEGNRRMEAMGLYFIHENI